MNHKCLQDKARNVLEKNQCNDWTIPSEKVYSHQWLWDSCFIAIGYARYDIQRAKQELLSLLRGQWKNGMMPHMIFSPQPWRPDDARLWKSYHHQDAPKEVNTSGITQPPVMAEATHRVAEKLSADDRKEFLGTMVPALVKHHQWLYRERDPDKKGLVVLFHPWESGLDNTPSWTEEIKQIHTPRWWHFLNGFKLQFLLRQFRADRHIPPEQRLKVKNGLAFYHAANALVKRNYDTQSILKSKHFLVESLSFNSILIRNNQILKELAQEIDISLPHWLEERMQRANAALEEFCWDEQSGLYSHRTYSDLTCVAIPTAASFLPLYSGAISEQRADQLVRSLKNEKTFWSDHPVPTVPLSSPFFEEKRFWRGPTWVNTNWLIIQGLKQYGYTQLANELADKTLSLVEKSGFYEYFSPLSGEGLGAKDFSWTASLAIDLLAER